MPARSGDYRLTTFRAIMVYMRVERHIGPGCNNRALKDSAHATPQLCPPRLPATGDAARRCRGATPSARSAAAGADVRDPQLDPEQHRRRPEWERCILPYGTLDRQIAQQHHQEHQQQEHQEQLLQLPRRHQRGQQHLTHERGQRRVVRGDAGHLRVRARDRCRSTPGPAVWGPGVPEPGTVQDQSSCTLILHRGAPAQSPSEVTPPSTTLPACSDAAAGPAGGDGITSSGFIDGALRDGDGAGKRNGGEALQRPLSLADGIRFQKVSTAAVVGIPCDVTADTVSVSAVMSRQLAPQQLQPLQRAVLVPLWVGQGWVPPIGSHPPSTTVPEPLANSRRRGPPASKATAQATAHITSPSAAGTAAGVKISSLPAGVTGADSANSSGGSLGTWGIPGYQSVPEQGRGTLVGNSSAADGKNRRPDAGGADGRKLMRTITDCRHWRQLRAVFHGHGREANILHVTAALGRLARMRLPSPPPPMPEASGPRKPPLVPPLPSQHSERPDPTGEAAEVQALLSNLEAAFQRFVKAARPASDDRTDLRDGSSVHGHGSGCHNRRGSNGSTSSYDSGHSSSSIGSSRSTSRDTSSVTPRLGPRQLATCLAALGRLRSGGWRVAGDPMLLRAAVELSRSWELDAVPPQELTTLAYSFAKLGLQPGDAWLEAACAAASGAAAGRRMSPRQLSTFLWALATLRHQPGEAFMAAWIQAAVRAMARFSAYDISQALWALATLHIARLSRPSAAAAEPRDLPEIFVRAALGRARAALCAGCEPQDVCNTLWAVSQLQLAPPRAWVAAVAAALLAAPDATLARCQPADLTGLLWALARLLPDVPPPRGEMLRIIEAAARLAGRCGEQDLANVFWALGSLRFVPPPSAMRAFGLRLLWLCARGAAGPQLLSTALWCCVRLRIPSRPALLRQLLAAAAHRAPEFDSRSAPLLIYSLARLHHLGWLPPEACRPMQPPQVQLQPTQLLQAQHEAARAAAWPAAPTVLKEVQRLNAGQVEARSTDSTNARPTVKSAPASAALLDLGPFLDAAMRGIAETEVLVERSRPRLALPVLLWSIARLGHRPEEGWTRAYLAHSFEVLPLLSPAEACLVVSALLRLGHLPPPLWLAQMEHLMARTWGPAAEQEAAHLRREAHALARRAAAAVVDAGAAAASDGAQRHAGVDLGTAAAAEGSSGSGSTVALTHRDREWWRQRERQRRRKVAARVLGQRLAACRDRLALLGSSMARLRQGLACLRARVRARMPQEGQQVQQPQATRR